MILPLTFPGLEAPDSQQLKPMATAPRGAKRLLVVDQYYEMGLPYLTWAIVRWHDAWSELPAGWHGNGHGDLRDPQGWLCELPWLNEGENESNI
jgi:hypothetical protein